MKEVTATDGEVILFIDEILYPGQGAGGGNGDGCSQYSQAGIGRGELRTIGPPPRDEYQKYFEKDKALGNVVSKRY